MKAARAVSVGQPALTKWKGTKLGGARGLIYVNTDLRMSFGWEAIFQIQTLHRAPWISLVSAFFESERMLILFCLGAKTVVARNVTEHLSHFGKRLSLSTVLFPSKERNCVDGNRFPQRPAVCICGRLFVIHQLSGLAPFCAQKSSVFSQSECVKTMRPMVTEG